MGRDPFLNKFPPSRSTRAGPQVQVRDEHVYREGPQGDEEAGVQATSLSSGWFPLSRPPFPEHAVGGAQREGRGAGSTWDGA